MDVKFMHKLRTKSGSSKNGSHDVRLEDESECGGQEAGKAFNPSRQSAAHLAPFSSHSELLKDTACG